MTMPALTDQANTDLMLTGSQTAFTDRQVALLRQVGIEDATDADLDLFFHHCRRTGLDPFARQIYMVGRDTKINVRVQLPNGNTRVEEKRVTKFTIQTGIDGYRLIGERTAAVNGDEIEHDEPLWRGKPGTDYDRWLDYWPESAGSPAACKYTIWKNGKRRTAVVNFGEYAQYSGRGELTSMWKKMPANQIAKCAEAQAWRKAYPADFSGIILEGTDQGQVIDSDGAPARVRSERVGRGVDSLRQLGDPEPQPEPDAGPPADVTGTTEPHDHRPAPEPSRREKWMTRLGELLDEADCRDISDRLIVVAKVAKTAALINIDALSDAQLRTTVNSLNTWSKAGVLGQEITDILNTATLAAENTEQEN